MKIITAYQKFKEFRNSIKSISFVPTMGNLHKGHMALIDKAKSYDSHVTASIFINPLQFNDASDFNNYPKSLDDDIGLLSKHGCDSVFIPDSSILENIKEIKAPDTATYLCGMNRPGHFDGVLTIVNKLFEIIKPTRSFFGKKDFQQLTLIKNFVIENNLPIEIISVDTVRAGTLGGIAKAWDSATKRKVCSAFSYKPRKASNIVARIHLRNGWYPKRNVRKGTRQALKLVC